MGDDTASVTDPGPSICAQRPNPLGIVALSGAAWIGTGAALAVAGLPPLWAAGLGYLLAPVLVLALLAARHRGGAGRAGASVAEWEADRARDAALTVGRAESRASQKARKRRVA